MQKRLPPPSEEEETLADRRSSSAAARLCAGIFLLYQRETGTHESDPFVCDGETWSRFEKAALPEMRSFTFFDRAQNTQRTPGSVLADVMGEIWLAKEWPDGLGAIPSTIQVVTEMANRIAGAYEINPVERRSRKRASLGLDVVG